MLSVVRRRRQIWRCWWFELLLLGALGLSFALCIQTKLISSIKHPSLQSFMKEVLMECLVLPTSQGFGGIFLPHLKFSASNVCGLFV